MTRNGRSSYPRWPQTTSASCAATRGARTSTPPAACWPAWPRAAARLRLRPDQRQRLQRPRAEGRDLGLLRRRGVDEGGPLQGAPQQAQLVRRDLDADRVPLTIDLHGRPPYHLKIFFSLRPSPSNTPSIARCASCLRLPRWIGQRRWGTSSPSLKYSM